MKSLQDIILATLEKLGLKTRYAGETVILHWPKIVGAEIAVHTQATKIYGGVLFVAVSNSVWSHHLLTMKTEIIAKINSYIGNKLINDIKFHAGYLKNSQNEENTDEKEENIANKLKNVLLTEKDISQINCLVSTVSDEKLRSKLAAVLRKDWSFRKYKLDSKWTKCHSCSVLCPPGEQYCRVCLAAQNGRLKASIRNLLTEVPWLDYQECSQYIHCTPAQFYDARNELINRYAQEIVQGNSDTMKAAALLMLVRNLKPENITAELIDQITDRVRRKKNVFAFGR